MADSENTRTVPAAQNLAERSAANAKPNDDPSLAMCVLWERDRNHYDDMLRLTSNYERTALDAAPDGQDEAQRVFQAQANVSRELGDKLERFTRAIFRTKAQSIAGASAKLAVAIRHLAPSPSTDEEPWPYLRNVHADLERLLGEAANSNDSAERKDG